MATVAPSGKDLAQTVFVEGEPMKLLPEVLSLLGIKPFQNLTSEIALEAITLQSAIVQARAAERFRNRVAEAEG